MARPRKPIATLEAQGTARKCRHSKRADEPSSGTRVTCPSHLRGVSAKFWKAIVPKLEAMGILDGIDQSQLEGLSIAWANWRNEQKQYTEGVGHIYKVTCAWNSFDKIAGKFGMNPVDRTKLATAAEEDADPFTEWLKKKRGDLN